MNDIIKNRNQELSISNLSTKLEITNKLLQLSNLDKIIWEDEKFGHFTDSRDLCTYKIVKIGIQVWMEENLRYMPHVSPPEKQGGIWVYNYFGNNINEAKQTENYVKFGCLYDWTTAMKISPKGWSLPQIKDINKLWYTYSVLEFMKYTNFRDIKGNFSKRKMDFFNLWLGKDLLNDKAIVFDFLRGENYLSLIKRYHRIKRDYGFPIYCLKND